MSFLIMSVVPVLMAIEEFESYRQPVYISGKKEAGDIYMPVGQRCDRWSTTILVSDIGVMSHLFMANLSSSSYS